MSAPAACRDCFNLGVDAIGFGSDFESLSRLYTDTIERLRNSETLGGALSRVLDSLKKVFQECGSSNWDGYGALPIARKAVAEAEEFLNMLPANIPMPEIVPEPNGEIAMEWRTGKRKTFIISLSGENEIIYAGLFGLNRIRGREYFVNSIPHNIIRNIRRIYDEV